jgi:hypothetical protein
VGTFKDTRTKFNNKNNKMIIIERYENIFLNDLNNIIIAKIKETQNTFSIDKISFEKILGENRLNDFA